MASFDNVSVWILDSSSLIRTKSIVDANEQENAFIVLEDMVRKGQILMPKQVIKEVSEVQHLDLPGAWAIRVKKYLKHTGDVDHRILSIIQLKCPQLTDYTKDSEDADPYVVALAYQLQNQEIPYIAADGRAYEAVSLPGLQEQKERPCIVTEDKVDRIVTKDKVAQKIQSIVSACKQLKLKYTYTRDFLTHLSIPTKNKTDKE